jgi:hypothetical protein
MSTLIKGELIKTATTRTLFGYAAIAVVLAIAQVLVTTLPASGEPTTVDDKMAAIAGLPLLLLLLGLVGAASGTGRSRRPCSSRAATAQACSPRAPAPTP